MIIEITRYNTAQGVTEDTLMTASKEFDRSYCSRCKGLVSRQFVKTDSGYMDIFQWESKEDVERVQATFMDDADALAFANLLDANSLTMHSYELLDSYRPARSD